MWYMLPIFLVAFSDLYVIIVSIILRGFEWHCPFLVFQNSPWCNVYFAERSHERLVKQHGKIIVGVFQETMINTSFSRSSFSCYFVLGWEVEKG